MISGKQYQNLGSLKVPAEKQGENQILNSQILTSIVKPVWRWSPSHQISEY